MVLRLVKHLIDKERFFVYAYSMLSIRVLIMKKSLLLLVVSIISCLSTQDILSKDQKKSMNNNSTCTQIKNSQIVIAFDLHEVVFSFSYSKFFNSVYTFFRKNPYALTLANPFAGYRVVGTLYSNSKTAENIYNKLTVKHYPWLADSKTEFLNICNSYILDPEMKLLLEDLKKQGYRLAVCSNIGHEAFEHFKREHAEVFDMFEVVVTSHPERNYMRKPAPEFFNHFKKDVQKVVPNAAYYIFIDDKKSNARAAQELGIQGIVFKSPVQLRRELKDLGVSLTL